MKKHINIPVFVPHMGCPNACVFCNQKMISGHDKPDFSNVKREIEKALETTDAEKQEIQIAFFGGSFTGIDRGDMLFLLGVAKEFIDSGRVHSIRLSTRPDYIDSEIIEILLAYGVKTVELGIQSSNNRVLSLCGRGHTFEDTKRASSLIVSSGLELVGQMMIGLPGSTPEDEIATAKDIVSLGAVAQRIYPTVVFKGTELSGMVKRGVYTPMTHKEAVERTENVFEVFVKAGVRVIRIGLQSGEGLTSGRDIACGDYSEAIGEMCISLYFLKKLSALCERDVLCGKSVTFYVNGRRLSSAAGYGAENRKALMKEYNLKSIRFLIDNTLEEFDIRAEAE